jgi:hypothetical protein
MHLFGMTLTPARISVLRPQLLSAASEVQVSFCVLFFWRKLGTENDTMVKDFVKAKPLPTNRSHDGKFFSF